MMTLSESIKRALVALHDRLKPLEAQWLVGGSCGLLLQGVPIGREPRDLDVYMDESGVKPFYELLADAAVDLPQFSRTPIYESILSHYDLSGVQLEAVGGFLVRAEGAQYRVEIAPLLAGCGFRAVVEGRSIPLMPLAHELAFNMLRGRPDRYEPIAAAMKRNMTLHLPPLLSIVGRNTFTPELLERMNALLDVSLLERMAVSDAGSSFFAGR